MDAYNEIADSRSIVAFSRLANTTKCMDQTFVDEKLRTTERGIQVNPATSLIGNQSRIAHKLTSNESHPLFDKCKELANTIRLQPCYQQQRKKCATTICESLKDASFC
ncbi:hypothetical protein GQX74_012926 [Glossina fuscipes]|nr:hypothetical protein GQX74_012926 [Glossina fuscipes]